MGLLPALAWLLAFVLWQRRLSRTLALGLSATAAYAWSFFWVEGLSALGLLHAVSLTISWLVFAGMAAGFYLRYLRQFPVVSVRRSAAAKADRVLLGWIAAALLLTFLVAVRAAPNNWDSMTYHLSRVAQWASRGSVLPYATAISRQISQPPAAEYAILQSYWLSGCSDRWANLVQWAALLLCAAGAYELTGKGGLPLFWNEHSRKKNPTTGLWTVLLLCSMPMALLQSNSTQNDLVLAATLLWTLVFGLRYAHNGKFLWGALACLSAGLALATKGTAVIYLPPMALYLLFQCRRQPLMRSVKLLPVLAFSLFLTAGPQAIRNLHQFGSVSGPDYALANAVHTVGEGAEAMLLNGAKNSAAMLRGPVPVVNMLLERGVHALHRVFHKDVNDGALHWPGSPGFSVAQAVGGQLLHEDYAPNTLIAWLLLLALFHGIATAVGQRKAPSLLAEVLLLIALLLFFPTVLRWQVWHSRLLLPWFVLAVPVLGSWLSTTLSGTRPAIRILLAVLLVAGSLPALLANRSRPLLGANSIFRTERLAQYFANRPEAREGFELAASAIAQFGAQNTRLSLSGDSWEYPLWVLAKPDAPLRSIEKPMEAAPTSCPVLLLSWRSEETEQDTLRQNGCLWVRSGPARQDGSPSIFILWEGKPR